VAKGTDQVDAAVSGRGREPAFPHAFPTFRDHHYWMQEYEELVGISEARG
jgi:hypothetical protein